MSIIFFQSSDSLPTDPIVTIVLAIIGSGILGAVVALIGVNMQNRAQGREKKIEREMALRRDVYLSGAEAVGKMRAFLAQLANPYTPEEKLSGILSGVTEAVHKVYVIGRFDLLKALDELDVHHATSHQELILLRNDCREKIEHAKVLEEMIKEGTQQWGQLAIEIDVANSNKEASKAQALLGRQKALFKDQEKIGNESRELNENVLRSVANTITVANEKLATFDELAAKANYLVREELGFDIDRDEYFRMVQTSNEIQRQRLAEFHKTLLASLKK